MFNVTHIRTACDATKFVQRYRDPQRIAALCVSCPRYGRCWSCPPYDYDVSSLSDGFTTVLLMASRIGFSEETQAACLTAEDARNVATQAINSVWSILLPILYEFEHQYPGSRCFTGRCRLCEADCTRAEGKPCRHPHLLRHSLESAGFDVVAATHDLLGVDFEWSASGQLPASVTLVTALFVGKKA